MNVFDFDNTIYDGECSLDFFKYCIKRKPSLAMYLPRTASMALRYKAGKVSKEEVAEFGALMLGVLASNADKLNEALADFWKRNEYKLKPEILKMISSDDVIVSASPSFMFDGIRHRLGGADVIATAVDIESKKVITLCYGENKVTEFKKKYPGVIPENFYTDNFNDMPMLRFAREAWLVEGVRLRRVKKHGPAQK